MADATEADATALIGWLADRDVPCPLCGYNLRGLASPRCPECGQPLRLGVSLAEPYLRAWVTTAAALLLPAGMGLLWIAVLTFDGPPRGGNAALIIPMTCQIACVPLAAVALLGRRRMQRWPRAGQRSVAAVAAGTCVVSFLWVFAAIFR